MLRGKERKKRKKEQICKVKQRQIKKIYVHLRLTARGKEQQEKQTKVKCRKNNNRFKKIKLKKEEKSTELQKPNVETEVYNNNRNYD